MLAIYDIRNKLTFDLLILKAVSKSQVTWATSVPILVFLGLSVLDLGPMYATDVKRQTASSLNAPWAGHNKPVNNGRPTLPQLQCRGVDPEG